MALGVSDELLGTFVPIAVFWAYSGIHMLVERLGFLEDYRLHRKEEEDAKNTVSRAEVIRGVLFMQALQIAGTLLAFAITGDITGAAGKPKRQQPPMLVVVVQFIVAMLVLDTWNYFGHRLMHMNKFFYKHVHAKHHRLVVPYVYGAAYVHPVEGLVGDTFGSIMAVLVSGMTPRTAMFFFCFGTMKAVDDHCALWFPKNPFHVLFCNNAAFHDVHHQLYGNKYNFSTPFFLHWDKLLGTYMPFTLEKRPQGGWEVHPVRPTSQQGKKE